MGRFSVVCVTLYVMLVEADPFDDYEDPMNFCKTIGRITIAEIKKHPSFMKNLPKYMVKGEKTNYDNEIFDQLLKSVNEVNQIIQDAKIPREVSTTTDGWSEIGGSMDPNEDEFDLENEINYSADHSAKI
ncbi:serine/threonine-protein kinase SRK2B-like [Lactuca sativa]|uniref:serine/threonine-protein kinase SRK2B-like n=1 Tax=Lactuca sativa TaxID=4236 RepID=UPI000CD81E42|nr:serine/threonine-protein kinase SRK2B-like [Lactuca sativa]